MNADRLRKVFEQVRRGKLSPDEGVELLRHLPFEDLDFAKIDHHRALRVGMPEVILGQGKTPAQVGEIFARLARHSRNVLATRASNEQFAAVKKKWVKVEIRQRYKLADAAQAHRDLEARKTVGASVIVP